jgi:uncharacterized protein (TIGR00725 family)
MGSGRSTEESTCRELGQWLARTGVHLLTGAGGGVMKAVSRAFFETPGRRGMVIGIVPAAFGGVYGTPAGYPNPWVEIPIYTHLPRGSVTGDDPLSRNHINVLSSDVVVALPGSEGTACEVRLALMYRRPLVAYLAERGQIPDLPTEVPVRSTLEGVQTFVRRTLGNRLDAC